MNSAQHSHKRDAATARRRSSIPLLREILLNLAVVALCCDGVSGQATERPHGPSYYEVYLSNGTQHQVESVEQADEGTWKLGIAGGVLQVPPQEVQEIRCFNAAEPATAQSNSVQITVANTRSTLIEIDGKKFRVALADAYRRSSSSTDSLVVFVDDDNQRSIRFARSAVPVSSPPSTQDSPLPTSVWQLPRLIKKHHQLTYSDYQLRGEMFTSLDGRAAWLLSFSFSKGKQRWQECQGFIQTGDSLLVVSSTVPEESDIQPQREVRSIGTRLEISEEGAKP